MQATKQMMIVVLGLAAAALDGTHSRASAQGYGLYEQGACAMGRAGAGVADPCNDGSSMYFNPAGLALDSVVVGSAGATGIAPRGQFTNSTSNLVSPLSSKTYVAGTGYLGVPSGRRVVVGVGVFAPYGLSVDWPTTSEGRFLSYKSSVHSIYVQPTVAFRITDHFLVGGGVDITHTSVELRRRADMSLLPLTGTTLTFRQLGVPVGTDFADVGLTGTATGAGGHVGVIVKANDQFSIGARYLSRQNLSFDSLTVAPSQISTNLTLPVPLPGLPAGTPLDRIVAGAFASGQALSTQAATMTLPLPDQFVAGIAVQPVKGFKILADYQWTHWKLLDQIVIKNQFAPPTTFVETFADTNGVRVGIDCAVGRGAFRAGFDVHDAAAPDQTVTPLLPEASRQEFTAGASVPAGAFTRFDFAYMFVHQSDRSGRTTDGGLAAPTTALNNGTYHYYANLFGASIVFRF